MSLRLLYCLSLFPSGIALVDLGLGHRDNLLCEVAEAAGFGFVFHCLSIGSNTAPSFKATVISLADCITPLTRIGEPFFSKLSFSLPISGTHTITWRFAGPSISSLSSEIWSNPFASLNGTLRIENRYSLQSTGAFTKLFAMASCWYGSALEIRSVIWRGSGCSKYFPSWVASIGLGVLSVGLLVEDALKRGGLALKDKNANHPHVSIKKDADIIRMSVANVGALRFVS